MADEHKKLNLSLVLTLIVPFDIKKINNVLFYLKEFDDFMDFVDIEEDFRLQILKTKFVGNLTGI